MRLDEIENISLNVGFHVAEYLERKYKTDDLSGFCKEAADLMIVALKKRGITASKHFGWCLYDSCDNITGEPCAPHCYVLVHFGRQRKYLDCTATQFSLSLDRAVPKVIFGDKPSWLKASKPSIKTMAYHCGY